MLVTETPVAIKPIVKTGAAAGTPERAVRNDSLNEAVQFTPENKSTMAQFKYTNYVIDYWKTSTTPVGGGWLFYQLWTRYFPQ